MALTFKLLNRITYLEKKQKSLDTAIGMDRAAKEGRQVGHPSCVVPELFIKQYKNYETGVYGGMGLQDFCRMANVSKTYYYKYEKLLKMERIATINPPKKPSGLHSRGFRSVL